jgi:hypothetical protein
MPRIDFDFLMTSWMRALAGLARWERPTRALSRASSDQPGRFEQGPDEKYGRLGLKDGFMIKTTQIGKQLCECPVHPLKTAKI